MEKNRESSGLSVDYIVYSSITLILMYSGGGVYLSSCWFLSLYLVCGFNFLMLVVKFYMTG